MSVDPSNLKKLNRRRLGAPPTDGSPEIEAASAPVAVSQPPVENETTLNDEDRGDPPVSVSGQQIDAQRTVTSTMDRGERMDSSRPARIAEQGAIGRGNRETSAGSKRRHRVPPSEAEPRIPFTTRVSASTKERLEEACHVLRRKHQDFINEALSVHLRKHGF